MMELVFKINTSHYFQFVLTGHLIVTGNLPALAVNFWEFSSYRYKSLNCGFLLFLQKSVPKIKIYVLHFSYIYK
jgi:hypothetical protein